MNEENFHVYIPVKIRLLIKTPIKQLYTQGDIPKYMQWIEKEVNKQLEGDGDTVELTLDFKANIRRIK